MKNINKVGAYFGIEGTFASWFVLIGLFTQLLTCYIMKDTAFAVCSGIAGVISVVLCSQKKYSFYFWGLLQLITIIIISYQSNLYGKVLENIFYLITTICGMFIWNKKMINNEVKVKKMDLIDCVIFLTLFLPLSLISAYFFINNFSNSEQVILDTITTTIGILAQIMLILRFREQWILWFILDVMCVILWAKDGNWCIMMQYVFWTINCIYGFFKWKNLEN